MQSASAAQPAIPWPSVPRTKVLQPALTSAIRGWKPAMPPKRPPVRRASHLGWGATFRSHL